MRTEFDAVRAIATIEQICSASKFLRPDTRPTPGKSLRRYLALSRKRLEIILGYFRKLDHTAATQEFFYEGEVAVNALFTSSAQFNGGILFVGHHDYCAGLGAEDNASALGVMLELARCLGNDHGVAFASFDLEEDYMVGSRHFVSTLTKQKLREFQAVIALECLGSGKDVVVCERVSGAVSDPVLVKQFCLAAERCGHKLARKGFDWFYSDHVPFAEQGARTMEICSLSVDDYEKFIRRHDPFDRHRTFNVAHTRRDVPRNVRQETIQTVGESLLQFVRGFPSV